MKKAMLRLKLEIIEAFPTGGFVEKPLLSRDYLDLCYAMSRLRFSDALKILPTVLLKETELVLKGLEGSYGDGIIYWLEGLDSRSELCLLTSRQLSLLIQWIHFVATPLYGETVRSSINTALKKLNESLLYVLNNDKC